MSIRSVAKKDFLDVRRSKSVWIVSGLYALLVVCFFYLGQSGPTEPNVVYQLSYLTSIGRVFIPIIALMMVYLAIAGERESGSIRYLLSLPNTRRDIVLGKYLSRGAVGASVILVAFGVGAVLAVLWYPSLEPTVFAGVAGLTVLLTLAYVSVAISISAATGSRSRAMAGSIGFYFISNLMMLVPSFSIVAALKYVLNGRLELGLSDHLFEFLRMLSPTIAFKKAFPLVVPSDVEAFMVNADPSAPAYLAPEVAFAILIAWLVIPAALGLWQFNRADLG
ncbi:MULTISPECIES: ABC transporter permease [unclassified Natrinema]|uniref:ABC transporter permease n=1 Tax=unclassified Natrinema TaxID=2622230 RepID=UPI00026D49AE|nr:MULTISPECIES: ABC transporter permease subunit [unclassified Natrinema]AFO57824.1 ABC-2 type transporter [Natrinema sp. J7-2]